MVDVGDDGNVADIGASRHVLQYTMPREPSPTALAWH
jgi:hypothetical protein